MSAAWTMLQRWQQQGRLRRVDVALAQACAQATPDTPPAVLIALAICSNALSEGHVALPSTAIEAWFETDAAMEDSTRELHQTLQLWMRDRATPHPLLCAEHDALALRAYADAEQALADALRHRLRLEPASRDATTIDHTLAALWAQTAQDDPALQACRASATRALTLLTGGPGTGKTTTIARMVVLHRTLGIAASRIGLAAPTGKAAARLNAALRASMHADAGNDLPVATTVHRLLGLREEGGEPAFHAGRPLPLEVLIVDEASMLDLPRWLALLRALPERASLVLVGDGDQLPSVEAGSVLRSVAEAPGMPTYRLQHVHRQREGSAILALAEAVRDGDADAALHRLTSTQTSLSWSMAQDTKALAALAAPRYAAMHAKGGPAQALQAGRSFRVLCAAHGGKLGTRALNRAIAREWMQGEEAWFDGRWCLIERNLHALGLFNGDLGLCLRDATGALRVWFGEDDAPRSWHPDQLGELPSAFALSVHKAQGSEFDDVLLVLPEADSPLLSREWLYTAITRAKSGLHVVGSEAAIRTALGRRSERWGTLAARLRNESP